MQNALREPVLLSLLSRIPRAALAAALCALCTACANLEYTPNTQRAAAQIASPYQFDSLDRGSSSDSLIITVSLSGGGYRAAAFAYAVLLELSNTPIVWQGSRKTLLDEVDWIVSVSGGSIAAMHFALDRDNFFQRFVPDVLENDLQAKVFSRVTSPRGLWRATSAKFGRGDILQEVLDEQIFQGKTFRDLPRRRPQIVVNASDMSTGDLFQFSQEQFDFLCSDINALPLSRAVAASMAVPIVFSPITLLNYDDRCPFDGEKPVWGSVGLRKQRYVHLLDGGLADNLGVRGPLEVIAARGGLAGAARAAGLQEVKKLAFIVVNSQVTPELPEDTSPNTPGIWRQARAVIDIPINRYTRSSMETLHTQMQRWQLDLQTSGSAAPELQLYAIEVNADDPTDPHGTRALQAIPTSLRLSQSDIESIIAFAQQRLRRDPAFQRLLKDLAGAATSASAQ